MYKRVLICIDNTEHCLNTIQKGLRQILQALPEYYLQKEDYPTYGVVQENINQLTKQVNEIDKVLSLLQDFRQSTEEENSEE